MLEDDYGIIGFDEAAGTFDFIEDATGANDFKRFISKKRSSTKVDINLLLNDEDLKRLVDLSPIATAFSSKHLISTNEWQFIQDIAGISSFTDKYIDLQIKDWQQSTSAEKAKGKVIWIYINDDCQTEELDRVFNILKGKHIETKPIVIMLLNDSGNQFYSSLIDYHIIYHLTEEEKAKYARFTVSFIEKQRWLYNSNLVHYKQEEKE